MQRVGLSATQRPLDEIARFLGGDREVTIVDAGASKELDLEVVVPVDDMRELGAAPAVEGEPRVSIWPAVYPRLLDLVRDHRSTIVFVNSRRSAERVANRLNELAGEPVARAHHGSVAREQRLEVEDMLKRGVLPALVATSSLELGIDMGAVDLVVQIESPKSVAAGLQRVGRAGHSVGQASRGRFFPKWRGDLLETAVVTRRMREGAIERTRVPRQPLDVLAQQIVAMTAMDEWSVDDLHALVRRCHPYGELSRPQLEGVLEMLAGRYPSDEFAELRPRIVWDRIAGTVRGREGSARLAVTSGGTIPDRGLYGVFLPTRARGSASWTRRWCTRLARARCSSWVPPHGGSSRSPATGCSSRTLPVCRARCRSGRAMPWAGPMSWGRPWGRPRVRAASATWTSGRPAT